MDTPTTPDEPNANPEATPPSSITARIVNVLAAPGEVFDEVKASPPCTANWLVPALIMVLVGWLGIWPVFTNDAIKQQMDDMMEQPLQKQVAAGKLTQEQADQQKAIIAKFAPFFKIAGGCLVPILAGFGAPFWVALILWLGGRFVLKGQFTYMQAVEVAGLATMIAVLESVVRTLLILVKGNLLASPSLVLLLPELDPNHALFGVLSLFNVFALWGLVVKSIGLARLSGRSIGAASVWVFGVWLVLNGAMLGVGVLVRKLVPGAGG